MLTISTFNCENLFSRSKILNFDSDAAASELLVKVATLDALLAKKTYSSDDKDKIRSLLDILSPVVEINQLRGTLFIDQANGERAIVAKGRDSWVGGIEFTRDAFPVRQQLNTARIIGDGGADIQCVVEVENRRVLEEFNAALPNPYPFHVLIDGNDDRGIDVGLLSRFEIVAIHTHIFDKGGTVKGDRVFSRDCLEVEVRLLSGRSLHVLINHLKSKRSSTEVDRRGIFGIDPTDANGAAVPPLDNLTKTTQASDHAAVIARFDI